MSNIQMIKVDRKNMLNKFFDSILKNRADAVIRQRQQRLESRMEFTGQHTSEKRQAKLAAMKSMGIKSGKVYRRTMKALRLTARLNSLKRI